MISLTTFLVCIGRQYAGYPRLGWLQLNSEFPSVLQRRKHRKISQSKCRILIITPELIKRTSGSLESSGLNFGGVDYFILANQVTWKTFIAVNSRRDLSFSFCGSNFLCRRKMKTLVNELNESSYFFSQNVGFYWRWTSINNARA